MRLFLALALAVSASTLCAQNAEDPEVVRARTGIEKLKALVDAGAIPRAQLEKAEAAVADAEDAAFLRKTLYGPDLTEDQADELIAATERRLDRRKKEYTKAEEMVRAGVISQLSLGTYLEEIDRSRKEYDLAVSRVKLVRELAEAARVEEELQTKLANAPAEAPAVADRYDGNGVFSRSDFLRVESAWYNHFSKPLPVSAMGETAVHRALGFDHRDRVDVAVHPDQPEGLWLRQFLTENKIPYFAFRHAVPGKATGAHIHIGPMSSRIARGG